MRKLMFIFLTLALTALLAVPAIAQDDMALPDFIQHTACDHDLTGRPLPIYHFGDLSGRMPLSLNPCWRD